MDQYKEEEVCDAIREAVKVEAFYHIVFAQGRETAWEMLHRIPAENKDIHAGLICNTVDQIITALSAPLTPRLLVVAPAKVFLTGWYAPVLPGETHIHCTAECTEVEAGRLMGRFFNVRHLAERGFIYSPVSH